MSEKRIILVVDDEAKILEVVSAYLEKKGYSVMAVDGGYEALLLIERENISLVILDLMLPDISGEEVCRRIRKISGIPVIMLTAKSQEEDLLNGLSIGADDYMTKPFSLKELYARVEAVLRRTSGTHVPSASRYSWNQEDLVVDFTSKEARKKGETVRLTPIEWRLLEVFVKYPQKVFTREELIAVAFDEDFDGYDRVIDTHIKNLRKKLETDSKNPIYIQTVHGVGYRFGGNHL